MPGDRDFRAGRSSGEVAAVHGDECRLVCQEVNEARRNLAIFWFAEPRNPGFFFCPAMKRIGHASARLPFDSSSHPIRCHSWGCSRGILAPTLDELFDVVDVSASV